MIETRKEMCKLIGQFLILPESDRDIRESFSEEMLPKMDLKSKDAFSRESEDKNIP